uniref:C2H2-type domain-containing protein n=1 Tax=Scleropages formosus TaxID=113540 RepID=A0A8C9U0Z6_SCLFO
FCPLGPCTQEEELGQAVQPRVSLNTGQSKQQCVPDVHWNTSDRMAPKQVLQEQQLNFINPAESKVHLQTICLETFASVVPLQKHLLNQEEQESTEPKPYPQTSDVGDTPHSTHSDCAPQGKSHNKGNVKHQCSECSKCFSSPSKLRRHCLIHTGQRPFHCWECGGTFRQLAHLKTHQQTHKKPWGVQNHTDEKVDHESKDLELQSESHVSPNSILCIPTSAVSDKVTENRNSMMGNIHRKHQCKLCFKCFASPYKLKRHNLIHTGQKPFRCASCGKTFRQAVHLKVHQQTHGRLNLVDNEK